MIRNKYPSPPYPTYQINECLRDGSIVAINKAGIVLALLEVINKISNCSHKFSFKVLQSALCEYGLYVTDAKEIKSEQL